jgi:hypothetical protein
MCLDWLIVSGSVLRANLLAKSLHFSFTNKANGRWMSDGWWIKHG